MAALEMQLAMAAAGVSGPSPKRPAQSPDASDESVQTNGNRRKSRKVSFEATVLYASEASTPTGNGKNASKCGGKWKTCKGDGAIL